MPELSALLATVRAIGKTVVAEHADDVDRDARFPHEAFAALKEAKLLSAYVPEELGGMGLDVVEITRICEALAPFCASTAMIYAMHQIQVAIVVHHALHEPSWRAWAEQLVTEQWLLASATTELGIGGDVRSSKCAVVREGDRYTLTKQAPVISYGAEADAIMVTARRAEDAGASDQVAVLVDKADYTLDELWGWDTLGFRGTCSSGFTLTASGPVSRVLPVPYADIHAKTMHAYAHCTWAALWLGLAAGAVGQARSVVRKQARKTPGEMPPSALRLAEVDAVLFGMRNSVAHTTADYAARLLDHTDGPFPADFDFAVRVSNLKVTSSQLVVEIVSKALMICGIAGYRNHGPASLSRALRDAHGAALMVNNDRILGQSAPMQILRRD